MKKFVSSLLGLLSLLFATSTFAQQPLDQARMFQGDASHTGAFSNAGIAPPLKQKWSVNFGQKISYPLIADGKVFVNVRNATGYGTNLYAIDAASGATLWSYPLGGSYYWSALCYENGRVFALNGSGLLRAFDPANGNVIWSLQLGATASAPTVYQGLIYTNNGGGSLVAINANDGSIVWTAPVSYGDYSSPAVTSEGLYVSYACPNVHKLNQLTGSLIWKNNPGCSGGGGKTPVLYNGRLYVRDSTNSIWDSQSGLQVGTYTSKNAPVFAGNMGYFLNGPQYFGSYGTLQGRDLNNNNSLVWSFAGDGRLQSGVLYADGYVYVGSESGKLYAVDAATGQQVWSTSAGASIPYVDEHNYSQPLTGFAAGEGLLVIPTMTTLVAYENDNTPPTVNWGVSVPAPNAVGWNKTSVDLPFTLAGIGSASPSSPLHFTSEGANQTQDVTLTDRSDNTSTVTSPVVNIDWTAPSSSIMLTGSESSGEWYSSVQVTLSGEDSLSGVGNTYYKVDNGATQTYSSPFSISNDGNHTVTYWSVDVAGNTESSHSTSVKIDGNAPATQASVSGTPVNGWYSDQVQVTLSASDNSSGVANSYYVIDSGVTQTYSNAFNVPGAGSHVVQYWSVDEVGNVETQHSVTINVDGGAPTTQIGTSGVAGTNGWYKSTVQVSLTWSDNNQAGVATTYYSVDGGATQTYSNTFSVATEGVHQVNYWSVDRLGNTESQKSLTVKIDRTGSTVQNAVTGVYGGNNFFKSEVQFSLTSSDNLSGVAATYYRIDDGPTQTYTSTFTVAGDGIHPVNFWSTDLAGNSNNSYTVMIRIDMSGPTTQANLSGTAGVNGWYRGAVQVSMSATDNFNGVSGTYYKLDGGATTTYTAPFNYSTVGSHTLSFWSVDTILNTETVKLVPLKIDTIKPTITMTVSPATATKSNTPVTVTVSGRVTDTTSGVYSLADNVVDEYGVTQPSGNVSWQANGNYSFTLVLPATKNTGDKSHLYTINMQVLDQAGNSTAGSGTVTIK